MAGPMRREERVMTAIFPDISNKVMRFSRTFETADAPVFISIQLSSVRAVRQPNEGVTSGEFAGGRGFRAGRLMHVVVLTVPAPVPLVDRLLPAPPRCAR